MIERLLLSMPRGLPMHQDGTVCPAQKKRGGEEERGRRGGGEKQADEAIMDQSRAVRVLEQRTGEEEMERTGGSEAGRLIGPQLTRLEQCAF